MARKLFTLKPEHITLLSHAYIRWEDCEFGAPAIDCKRPYGSGDVYSTMREILGEEIETCPHCHEALNESDDDRLLQLHAETETALQVILDCQTFEPGTYILDGYGARWRKADMGEDS